MTTIWNSQSFGLELRLFFPPEIAVEVQAKESLDLFVQTFAMTTKISLTSSEVD